MFLVALASPDVPMLLIICFGKRQGIYDSDLCLDLRPNNVLARIDVYSTPFPLSLDSPMPLTNSFCYLNFVTTFGTIVFDIELLFRII